MAYAQIDLGNTGLKTARFGIGTAYGLPAKDMIWAFGQGINYWFWGSYRRRNLPKALKILGRTNREKVIIATASYAHKAINSPLLLRLTVERVLKDLKTDYIDIFQLGWLGSEPSPKILDFLQSLKNKGFVNHFGISTHNRKLAAKLLNNPLFEIFMIRYNAVHRGAENEIFPFVDNKKHAIVAFTATRWGHLLSSPEDWPAENYRPTPLDCYRFVLSRPEISVCLTGAKNKAELKQNLRALEIEPMPEDKLIQMKEFGDHIRKTKYAIMDRSKK